MVRSQRPGQPGRPRTAIRPLIVGEAPSRTSTPARPLSGTCGDRLADLAGVPRIVFRWQFALANVFETWPGLNGKGTRWDPAAAVIAAERIRRRFVRGRIVVLLGRRVGAACGVRVGYFEPVDVRGSRVFVVPHPSGINRWYNDPANVTKMRQFMRRVIGGNDE